MRCLVPEIGGFKSGLSQCRLILIMELN